MGKAANIRSAKGIGFKVLPQLVSRLFAWPLPQFQPLNGRQHAGTYTIDFRMMLTRAKSGSPAPVVAGRSALSSWISFLS
jgi:hypothetical protein